MPTSQERQQRGRSAKTLVAVIAIALSLSGCSTMVAYTPKANAPLQTLKYT
ncbi:hypothetical protein [Variovorax sp. DT-64]|uniref:hypothetical protein n=1 Tax=Variovorax sp. DT-64 TaxID=3396160 RepID=UPI003F1D6424